MFDRMKEDITMIKLRDPAAKSTLEIISCYSGLHAIWMHLIAHKLWNRGNCLSARYLSQVNRFITGVEIHPGVKIGKRVFIDHGMGVVVGETSIIGDDVIIYQGVVLGGTSLAKEKRHPTVGSGVVIGAGAIVIGNLTLGNGSKIGAGAVVLDDVPPGTTAVGVPSRVVHEDRKCALDQEHQNLPDPVKESINDILCEIEDLKEEIAILKKKMAK
ncbi:MAG: serine O-acetyltransferase [Methanobrevibacter sp.]|jgi:serine O-acetyltransferase|nr:serine O-acetyltransferase [Candidatus Methanovirga australis]